MLGRAGQWYSEVLEQRFAPSTSSSQPARSPTIVLVRTASPGIATMTGRFPADAGIRAVASRPAKVNRQDA